MNSTRMKKDHNINTEGQENIVIENGFKRVEDKKLKEISKETNKYI